MPGGMIVSGIAVAALPVLLGFFFPRWRSWAIALGYSAFLVLGGLFLRLVVGSSLVEAGIYENAPRVDSLERVIASVIALLVTALAGFFLSRLGCYFRTWLDATRANKRSPLGPRSADSEDHGLDHAGGRGVFIAISVFVVFCFGAFWLAKSLGGISNSQEAASSVGAVSRCVEANESALVSIESKRLACVSSRQVPFEDWVLSGNAGPRLQGENLYLVGSIENRSYDKVITRATFNLNWTVPDHNAEGFSVPYGVINFSATEELWLEPLQPKNINIRLDDGGVVDDRAALPRFVQRPWCDEDVVRDCISWHIDEIQGLTMD